MPSSHVFVSVVESSSLYLNIHVRLAAVEECVFFHVLRKPVSCFFMFFVSPLAIMWELRNPCCISGDVIVCNYHNGASA